MMDAKPVPSEGRKAVIATTLRQRGNWPMADDNGWVSIANMGVTALSFVLGGIGTIFIQGLRRASAEGRAEGIMTVWKANIEGQIQAMNVRTAETEGRLVARLSAIEIHRERIDERLSTYATREELKQDMGRIETKLDKLSDYLHRERRDDRS